jgi:integrase
MRRAKNPKGRWEYKGQWIGVEPGRAGFYRYWYDDGSGRVKRKAMASVSIEDAKEELITILGPEISSRDPRQVFLFDVLNHYQTNYAQPKGYKQMAAVRRASILVDAAFLSFMGSPTVSDLTRLNQRRIWAHMASESGLSAKSIMTYMISVRAAVHYAAVPQLIMIAGEQTEVQMLDSPVTIFCNQAEIAQHIGGAVSVERQFIPTYEELGKWIDAIAEEDDFRYVIIALNTCARNEAIFDLTVSSQVDREFGTIDLNPVGRRQTKKRRPIIRMTTNLAAWFAHWGDDKPIRQYQDTVEKRLNKIGKTEKVGLPEMTCYTLRHFIATKLRRASFPVSREQRSKWLGHSVNEGSKTTDIYEKFDPDYLEEAMRATEEIMVQLQKHTKRNLFAPDVKGDGKLRVLDGGKL